MIHATKNILFHEAHTNPVKKNDIGANNNVDAQQQQCL